MLSVKTLNSLQLFRNFDLLNLLPNEYVIMGSGTLFAFEIRPIAEFKDLDIFVSPVGWEKVSLDTPYNHDAGWNCDFLHLFNDTVEIYNGWGPGFHDFETEIASALHIGKYTFAALDTIIRWKKENGREKDLLHLSLIDKYLRNQ